MNSGRARELFLKYAGAVAYVDVERRDGSRDIGTAFHVGEGVFVTARHVIEHGNVRDVATTQHTYVELHGAEAERSLTHLQLGDRRIPVHNVDARSLCIDVGPFFHADESVDVAVFKVADIDPRTPFVPLGGHLDDWLGDSDFLLDEAVVLGYPPIPLTKEPHIVASRAEINAIVDVRGERQPYFILSGTPRGGFSGGPAIIEHDYGLGVVTRSLLSDGKPSELGFFAVLTVEPIFTCLADHKLLPESQAEGWDDLWNSESEDFYERGTPHGGGGLLAASVELFDDGRRLAIKVHCHHRDVFQRATDLTAEALTTFLSKREDIHGAMTRFTLAQYDPMIKQALLDVKAHLRSLFVQSGLVPVRNDKSDQPVGE